MPSNNETLQILVLVIQRRLIKHQIRVESHSWKNF